LSSEFRKRLRALADNREAVFHLQVVVGIVAGLLFAVGFLDVTVPGLLIIAGVIACSVALGYLFRYLLKS